MTLHNQPETAPEEIIWGAKNIAVAIRRSKRSAFAMLEQGKIPGAKKVGGRWCFRPAVFRATFEI